MAPLGLVAAAVAFNLVALREERIPVDNLNDSSVHFAMVRWAFDRLQGGDTPLDGWFPYLSLGSPLFHYYQSLPHVLTGLLSLVVGPEQGFFWVLYLLLALWPLSVYWGCRLFDLSPWVAGAAALLSPLVGSLPGYGFEHGSYTWQGQGVWSQLWAMWLLPLALALSWRAVARRRSVAVAALVVGATVSCHFLNGYFALLALGIFVVSGALREFWARLGRATLTGLGALIASSFLLVPFLSDAEWANQSEFNRNTIFVNSYGARQVLGWLVSGEIFDSGRLPTITILLAVGVAVSVMRFRSDEVSRVFLGLFLLSLILFFGRPTLGPVVNLLPGGQELLFHRFIAQVHLSGILLAGVGAVWLVKKAAPVLQLDFGRRLAPIALALICTVVLLPAGLERWRYNERGGRWLKEQRSQELRDGKDLDQLVEVVKARGEGRVFAGLLAGWGRGYVIGRVPVLAELLNSHVDAIGFTLRTLSLTTDVEARFDESNPFHYVVFNIRYLIRPATNPPSVPARLLAQEGRHSLWRTDFASTDYLKVVDTTTPIVADRTNLGAKVSGFMGNRSAALNQFPLVAFGGQPAEKPTWTSTFPPSEPPGRVTREISNPREGRFEARVFAGRPSVVLLKATFHPRWKVTVDGKEVDPQMIAPSLVGGRIPAGEHTVAFRYQPYPYHLALLLTAGLALIALEAGQRRLRSRQAKGAADAKPQPLG